MEIKDIKCKSCGKMHDRKSRNYVTLEGWIAQFDRFENNTMYSKGIVVTGHYCKVV